MSLPLALMLLAAAPAAAPETVATADIVVLTKRLDSVLFKWNATETGGVRTMQFCTVVRSSGDREVDAITCRATAACLPVIDRIRRQRRPLFDTCLGDTRRRMISELFDARALALSEAGASQ